MLFGERVRALRLKGGLTQQQLADHLAVSVSYVSKVENEKLHFGDYPSEKFIRKLAEALDADEDELLMLTDRVPNVIRKRVRERPEAFRLLAALDDPALDKLLEVMRPHAYARSKRPTV
jgi:transcriptional regulator with XRE-family HTH domain